MGFIFVLMLHASRKVRQFNKNANDYGNVIKMGKALHGAPTLLTNTNGDNHLEQPAKRSGWDPRCHPSSDQKVETL